MGRSLDRHIIQILYYSVDKIQGTIQGRFLIRRKELFSYNNTGDFSLSMFMRGCVTRDRSVTERIPNDNWASFCPIPSVCLSSLQACQVDLRRRSTVHTSTVRTSISRINNLSILDVRTSRNHVQIPYVQVPYSK